MGRSEVTHCPEGRWGDIEIANHYRKLDGLELLPIQKIKKHFSPIKIRRYGFL